MASFRRLPSGKWQAIVRLPGGRRITRTHPLKGTVQTWARAVERARDLGQPVIDQAGGRLTLSKWHDTWEASLRVAPNTVSTYASAWRVHIEPYLADIPVGSLSRMDVELWQAQLQQTHGGGKARSREVALNVLSAMMKSAVAASLRATNPCTGVARPRYESEPGRVLTHKEAKRLLTKAPDPDMIAVMLGTGLRWSEAAGLAGDAVDWLRGFLIVRRKATPQGTLLDYGKSAASRRHVPVPQDVLERLSARMVDRDRDELLFASRTGGVLSYSNYRRDAWNPAVRKAKLQGLTPHDCRHTYASWLAEAGVDLYRVQQLLGHSSGAMVQRYAHLRPEHFTGVLQVLPDLSTNPGDARVTHGLDEQGAEDGAASL